MRNPPPEVIAKWPTPNYTDPATRGYAVLAINCVLLPVTAAIVALRLYTRLKVVHSAGLDDLFIGLAMVRTIYSFVLVVANKFPRYRPLE
jgi:hypothetical protein